MSEKSKNILTSNEYRILVEAAPIMIWRSDISTKCDYFNEIWLNFTGRAIEQELGNGWVEGVHKEDLDRCLDIYLSSFNKREVFEMDYRLRRHDGEYRWIFDRGVPFYDDNGEFLGYIGSCIDIQEKKLAEIKKEKEIKELTSYLPICAWCKNIRDDTGYWKNVEEYINRESGRDITHSMCPKCYQKHTIG